MAGLPFLLLLIPAMVTVQCQAWLLFNRTDTAGVQYIDGWYWIHVNYVLPVFHRIFRSGIIPDQLAANLGFNTIVTDDSDRLKILRKIVRYRLIRWVVALIALKVFLVLFVLVALPNIYFLAMMRTDEMDMK